MRYDVIVIGGGHAGCEAALAASKMGMSVCMFTMNIDTIGHMPCNPAIGGLAKGHLVREIDALGGQMAKAADKAGIQFRMLNRSNGPAVWSLRAQEDRALYKHAMRGEVQRAKGLLIRQAMVTGILAEGGEVSGVTDSLDAEYEAKAVILTTGTFLNGLIHIGLESMPAGRAGEFPSTGLTESLKERGFQMGRLKTGTPPRLDKKTIDFKKTDAQYGDDPPVPFSYSTAGIENPQVPCYMTYTNENTHKVIRDNLHRSPLYGGKIKGVGPRYCPSVEDKVVRFAHRQRHQVFLEPEGLDTYEYYANGISTSLPLDVQIKIVRSIEGLEDAEIMRPGYAVEYDFINPIQLWHSLESKQVKGLYFAGQINGTSGYEEAAAQGLMAGINASYMIMGAGPLVLGRHEAYIGVLIDDLVTKGTQEPYRMFTSRAEYRLLLRHDNADIRLREYGRRAGLVSADEFDKTSLRKTAIQKEIARLGSTFIKPASAINDELLERMTSPLDEPVSALKLLKRPEVDYALLSRHCPPDILLDEDTKKAVEAEVKYEGYIKRQTDSAERLRKSEDRKIPDDFQYDKVGGLSIEILQKLKTIRPANLGQAGRIPGVTPSALTMLMLALHKKTGQNTWK